MTWFDDLTDEMPDDGLFRRRIDPEAIEALLGRRGEGDAPAELSELDELVQTARQPGNEVELADMQPMSAAVAAIVQESQPESASSPGGDDTGRIRMVGKRRVAKVIGAGATSAALLAGGVAAAAVHRSTEHHASNARLAHARSVERAEGAAPRAVTAERRLGSGPNLAVVKQPAPPYAFGTVKSVDGSSAAGTCGTSGASGTFTVADPKTGAVSTVDVTPTTKFADPHAPGSATFASVCVGDTAGAAGTSSSTPPSAIAATMVYVQPPKPAGVHPPFAFGTVKSVDGSSAAGTCGTSGASGTFTVADPRTSAASTVDVTATTKFVAAGAPDASFANVCVGDPVAAAGAAGTAALTATYVFVGGAKPQTTWPARRPRSPEVSWFSGAPWGARGRMTASPQSGTTLASAAPQRSQQAQAPSPAATTGSQPQAQWGSGGRPQSQDPQGQGPQGQGGSQWGSPGGGSGSGPQRGSEDGGPQGSQGPRGPQGGSQH